MTELDQATQTLQRVRVVLETELMQARVQNSLVRDLDTQGLFERARQRSAFNVQLAQLEGDLGQILQAAGQRLGLAQLTLADLRRVAPQETAQLEQQLAEVQVLTEALREVDTLNRKLSERALGRVRRVLGTMAPQTVAYDRRGAHQPREPLSTSRQVA
jgi:FlgN protein